jgi:hypothetical protein
VIAGVISQDGPAHTGHLVRHGNNRFVPATLFVDSVDPPTQTIIFSGRLDYNRAGAMDEQASQITIASLADPKQDVFSTSGVLARDQTQRRGDISPTAISAAIANATAKGAGNDRAKSWNRLQTPAGLILLAELFEFVCIKRDVVIQFDKLPIATGEQISKRVTQGVVRIF